MTRMVHIADERASAEIRRAGLRLPRLPQGAHATWGVFALPLVPNFVVSHQWVRELKRRGFRVAVGVYFDVPDDEPVFGGRFNKPKERFTAAQAAAHLREHGTLGYEVIIPRSIKPAEIRTIRAIPQTIGWRYFPDAHARGVFCWCRGCQKGSYGAGRKWREFEASN